MNLPLAVLIVEDSESDALLVTRALGNASYQVTSERVETASQMRAALENRPWDIVISDYSLPHFDGRAALELLKAQRLDIPFIMVSGTMGEENAVAMMKAGAHDYLTKDNLARLGPAVTRELEQAQDRRQRKQAEDALRENKERFESTIEASGVGTWDWNIQTGEIILNERWAEIVGYSLAELAPISIQTGRALAHPDDLAQSDALMEKHFKGEEEFYEFESRMRHKNGQWVWVLDRGKVWTRDADGKPLRMLGTHTDITERKQTEAALFFLLQSGYTNADFFQSLARYLAESLGMDYICIDRLTGDLLSAQTVAVYYDGKFEDNVTYTLTDTPCGSVVGQTVCVFPRQVRHLFPQDTVLQEMLAESYIGTTLWNSQGQPIGLIAAIGRKPLATHSAAEALLKLVSVRAAGELERKQAESALRESEAFTQAIVNNSPIGISVRSRTGQLLSANAAWKKLWAIPEADVQTDATRERPTLRFDQRDDYLKPYKEEVRRVYEQGRHLHLPELKPSHPRPGAAQWVSQHFYAIQDTQGQVARVVILTEDITERKLAQDFLRESEERLAAVIEGSQLGYSDWNIQTGEIRRNERWAGMLGYTLNELEATYQQWDDLLHPDDRTAARQTIQDHLNGKTPIHRDEYRLRAKDGSYRWILDHGKIIAYDQSGRPLRLTATHTDITARKQAEESLRESEARYRAVAQSANEAIVSVDRRGNIVGWNRGAEIIFGYTEAEAQGQPLTLLMPSRHHLRHRAGVARIHPTAETHNSSQVIEREGRRKNGSEFPAELSLAAWRIGDAQFYTAIIRDVTARKQAEDQLRQLSRAVEYSPASIVITDVDGKIEYVNPKFTSLTGYSLAEVHGRTPRILKSDTTPPEVYPNLWQTILNGQEWRGELLNRKKNGVLFWESISISAINDSKGYISHFVSVSEDITARKEAEQKIHSLNLELEQLAITDYLTSLYNRRYFMQRGEEELKRARRSQRPLAALMIDIDKFKNVNDTYGHEAGDLVLKHVAATLRDNLREIDLLGRMGGEEFAILLPETPAREAAISAERVRQTVQSTVFQTPGAKFTVPVTICVGVAPLTENMSNLDDLLRNADAALYLAKNGGRNTVVTYPENPSPPPSADGKP